MKIWRLACRKPRGRLPAVVPTGRAEVHRCQSPQMTLPGENSHQGQNVPVLSSRTKQLRENIDAARQQLWRARGDRRGREQRKTAVLQSAGLNEAKAATEHKQVRHRGGGSWKTPPEQRGGQSSTMLTQCRRSTERSEPEEPTLSWATCSVPQNSWRNRGTNQYGGQTKTSYCSWLNSWCSNMTVTENGNQSWHVFCIQVIHVINQPIRCLN